MSTISAVQVDILRAQYSRVMRNGTDEEVLGLWNSAMGELGDKFAEVLSEEEIQKLEDCANQARVRLEKAEAIVAQKEECQKVVVKKPVRDSVRDWYEITAKDIDVLAGLLERKGHSEAAKLVHEWYNGTADLAKVVASLAEVLPACGFNRRVKWVSWEIHNRAKNALVEQERKEREAAENALAERDRQSAEEEKAFGFLAMPLRRLAALGRDHVPEQTLLAIEEEFRRSCLPANAWAPWALDALERLLDRADDEGQLAYAVGHDLFKQVMKAHMAECRGAFELVSGIHTAVHSGVERHRQANKKALAERQARRRASQLDRARRTNTPPGGRPKQKKKR